jgi:hypothetical protein
LISPSAGGIAHDRDLVRDTRKIQGRRAHELLIYATAGGQGTRRRCSQAPRSTRSTA